MRTAAKVRTRQRVLQAAWSRFVDQGYEQTTIRQIAADTQLSVGSVMAVGDKAGLLVSGFDALIEVEHAAVLRQRVAGRHCAEQCCTLVAPFVTLFTTHAPLARRYGAILLSGTHHSRIFTDLAQMLQREFRSAVHTCGCTESPQATRMRVKALYFGYLGAVFAWGGSHEPASGALERSVREIFTSICPRARSAQ